jgi:hypothetical protein
VHGHGQVVAGHQVGDALVDLLAQHAQVLHPVHRLGDGVGGRLHLLGALALGDVAGHRHPQAGLRQPAGRPQQVHHLAILAPVAVLEVQVGLAGHHPLGRLQGALPVLGQHQVDHAAPDQFLGRIAEDLPGGGADVHEHALRVDHADDVEQQVKGGRQRCCEGGRRFGHARQGLGRTSVGRSRRPVAPEKRGFQR